MVATATDPQTAVTPASFLSPAVTCPDGCAHLRELFPQPAWPAQHLPHTERWLPPAWQMPHDNLAQYGHRRKALAEV